MQLEMKILIGVFAAIELVIHTAAIMWIPVLVWWFHNGN